VNSNVQNFLLSIGKSLSEVHTKS